MQEVQLNPISIFYLEDDLFETKRVSDALKKENEFCIFKLKTFKQPQELYKEVSVHGWPDLFLLDMHLAAEDSATESGVDVLKELKLKKNNQALFVMYSSDVNVIKEAIKSGADDFVLKADSVEALPLRLYSVFKSQRTHQSASELQFRYPPPKVIGKVMNDFSLRMNRILKSAIRSVHVLGPSGAGKEVLANILESQLPENVPFVRINCGAITPSLLESELFGHAKGSFTGAQQQRIGLLEAASGGWIFLDEIASLTPSAQGAMLRAIENQEIIRVGESTPRKINLRFIAASNISLEQLVDQGHFRNDLFQRLREAEFIIPPLNDRREDIELFIEHFCETEPGGPYKVTPEARLLLKAADWSMGNIRGLRNTLRAMTEYSASGLLTVKGIPNWILGFGEKDAKTTQKSGLNIPFDITNVQTFDNLCDRLLVEVVVHLMSVSEFGSLRKISEVLGVSRTTLTNHIKRAETSHVDISKIKSLLASK